MPTPTNIEAEKKELSTQAYLNQLRNARLVERFTELYEKKRMRHDDVLQQLVQEFFITERTIRGILKNAPSKPAQPALKKGDQLDIFTPVPTK